MKYTLFSPRSVILQLLHRRYSPVKLRFNLKLIATENVLVLINSIMPFIYTEKRPIKSNLRKTLISILISYGN